MEKKFNRTLVKGLMQQVEKILSDALTSEYEVTVRRGNFSDDKVNLDLEIRMKDAEGSVVVAASTYAVSDAVALSKGLAVKGHVLGSIWYINGEVYEVKDYCPRRKRYPLSLKRMDGKLLKASFVFLTQGDQMVSPTKEDFVKWFTLDPDSDTIREDDAEICDKVQRYMEAIYPNEDGDRFFSFVDTLNEKGCAERTAGNAYKLLFEDKLPIEDAHHRLARILRDKKIK